MHINEVEISEVPDGLLVAMKKVLKDKKKWKKKPSLKKIVNNLPHISTNK